MPTRSDNRGLLNAYKDRRNAYWDYHVLVTDGPPSHAELTELRGRGWQAFGTARLAYGKVETSFRRPRRA